MSVSPVLKVMELHRFLAFGLGILMVFFPGPMHCGCLSRNLGHYEVLTFRMWGFFVFFLSHAVHACVVLGTPALRLRIAQGLFVMFTAGSSLYGYERIAHPTHEPTIAVLYVLVFGSLAVLYGGAVLHEPKEKASDESKKD